MRSSTIASVLFAAGTLATPVLDPRVVVTEQVVVTVTNYVTAGNLPPATTSASPAAVESPKVKIVVKPHRHGHKAAGNAPASTPKVVMLPTIESTPTSKKAEPVVVPTTSSTPVPVTTQAPAADPEPAAGNTDLPKTKVAGLTSESEIYMGLTLRHHNVHRSNHSVPALEWNQTLADFAKKSAKTCVFEHDLTPGGGGYGQNIAAGSEAGALPAILSNGFYNGEEPLYPSYGSDNADMNNFHKWGHFSQMVWESTESVGCYTYTCSPPGADPLDCKPDGTPYLTGENIFCKQQGKIPMAAIYTVCNYYPSGNVAGKYKNVKAPKGDGTVAMIKDVVTGL